MNINDQFEQFLDEEKEDEVKFSSTDIEKTLGDVDSDYLDPHDHDHMFVDILVDESDDEDEEDEDEDEGEIEEARVLSLQQRQRLRQRMKVNAKRLARLRQLKAKRMAPAERLKYRARKAALMLLRRRVAGKQGTNYSSLSPSQRISIDKQVVQRFGKNLNRLIGNISTRTLPFIRKKEMARLRSALGGKTTATQSKMQTESLKEKHDEKISKVDPTQIDPTQVDISKSDPTKRDPLHLTQVGKNRKVYLRVKEEKESDEDSLLTPKVNLLLRLGLVDADQIEKYRRALKAGEKSSSSPEMRNKIMSMLDKILKLSTEDPQMFTRMRQLVMKQRQQNEAKEDPVIGDRKGSQPAKYHSGLKTSTKLARDSQFQKQAKMSDSDPSAYQKAPGDANAKTRTSKHTLKYRKMFGELRNIQYDPLSEEKSLEGLKKKAEKSGIPYGILKQVYNRGMAAWKTGHRPGAGQQQWAYARVNSFITKGKGTWGGRDKDLAAQVRESTKDKLPVKHGGLTVPNPKDTTIPADHKEIAKMTAASKELTTYVKLHKDQTGEAVSPAQQAAIAIAMKKAGKKPKNEEVKQVDEISQQTKSSYVQKAKAQVKELEPHAKSGEYKDLAKNIIKKREKGIAIASESRAHKILATKFAQIDTRKKIEADAAKRAADELKKKESVKGEKKQNVTGEAVQRSADVRVVKVRNPDGTISTKKIRKPISVQSESLQRHRVAVTISDPQHTMVTKRKETQLKHIRVSADSKEDAVKKASEYYKKSGYKVHDAAHHSVISEKSGAGEEGTNELTKTYLKDTPGQTKAYEVASFSADKPMVDEADENKETGKSQRTFELVRRALSGKKSMNEEFIAGIPDAPTAAELGMTIESGFNFDPETEEEMLGFTEEEFEVTGDEQYEDWGEQLDITEAEYQGRKVQLGKPFRTPGGPKKTAVYVMGPKGNVVKVNFGDPNMTIKKNIPARRKSFRARHHCDTNPGPRWKARYWSCKAW